MCGNTEHIISKTDFIYELQYHSKYTEH